MKLARALKEKNKQAKELQTLISRAVSNNSRVKGAITHYDPKALMVEVDAKLREYVNFKTQLFQAAAEIRNKIFLLSELRSLRQTLQSMSTTEGVQKDRYDNNATEYVVSINAVEKDAMLKTLDTEIDQLQEEIDAFNATKNI
jgi:hypothetical protein